MRARLLAPPLLLAVLLACAAAPPPPVVDFRPSGTLLVDTNTAGDKEAAFDAGRLVARGVDLRRGDDGRWSGTVGGAQGTLEVTPERIVGPGIDVAISRAPGVLTVKGRVGGRQVELGLSGKGLGGWSDDNRCQFDFLPVGQGQYSGLWGCPTIPIQPLARPARNAPRATLTMTGDAALATAPSPQLELALLSVLPPY